MVGFWRKAGLAGAAAAWAGAAAAEDFTFRRVGVPAAGTPRITVQIDPTVPMFVSNRAETPFVPLTPEDVDPAIAGGGGAAALLAVFWRPPPPKPAE